MARSSISFTEPNEAWIQEKLDSKEYNSKTEVINELLRQQREKEDYNKWLRAELQAGIDSGIDPRPGPVVMQDIRERVLERLKKNGDLPT